MIAYSLIALIIIALGTTIYVVRKKRKDRGW
ncbi:LPXTG cell wall anchor domain-containing protein [Parasphingorhabdus halotolerans]|uniref:LPXTG cell wall anchor domain-containing protein n=1 Tax=Parasphingorhabdus halotolerans TaxID=2725558 RepID=A0A6H2DH12_9SPHN|nr:Loki-CTERM sorting domain-containing protein [Parasphingorhabdus halotolerans]QJB67959.1 LPXTG cell wall anchor domain-containing protein [Parasphingorhabdus halotolerans]